MICALVVLFFKQKKAYEMRMSDWSSDVCSSDLVLQVLATKGGRWCTGAAARNAKLGTVTTYSALRSLEKRGLVGREQDFYWPMWSTTQAGKALIEERDREFREGIAEIISSAFLGNSSERHTVKNTPDQFVRASSAKS